VYAAAGEGAGSGGTAGTAVEGDGFVAYGVDLEGCCEWGGICGFV